MIDIVDLSVNALDFNLERDNALNQHVVVQVVRDLDVNSKPVDD